MMMTIHASGAQRVFDHPVYCFYMKVLYVKLFKVITVVYCANDRECTHVSIRSARRCRGFNGKEVVK